MCVLCVDVCVCMYCPRRHSLDKPIIIHIFVQPQYTINTTIITITITTTFYLEGTVCICVVPEGIHVTSTLNMHLLLCATTLQYYYTYTLCVRVCVAPIGIHVAVLLSKVKIIKKHLSKVYSTKTDLTSTSHQRIYTFYFKTKDEVVEEQH